MITTPVAPALKTHPRFLSREHFYHMRFQQAFFSTQNSRYYMTRPFRRQNGLEGAYNNSHMYERIIIRVTDNTPQRTRTLDMRHYKCPFGCDGDAVIIVPRPWSLEKANGLALVADVMWMWGSFI
jgi:hypothetical protein